MGSAQFAKYTGQNLTHFFSVDKRGTATTKQKKRGTKSTKKIPATTDIPDPI